MSGRRILPKLDQSRLLTASRWLVLFAFAGVSPDVFAHVPVAAQAGGFLSGLLHPVLGPDHLLAMVAVGLWGAILGRPLMLLLPLVFPMLMLSGAALALVGVSLPGAEYGIALSVLALGVAVASAWRPAAALALSLVAVFGAFHGYAHGTELPASADPVAYAAGFIIATGLLHGAGILLGLLWNRGGGRVLVRLGGAAIGAIGTWFLLMPA